MAYTDANWGGCKDTRRSTTGWIIRLGNCWIDWKVHKQPTVALSSCEAEYMAICEVTQAIMWTIAMMKEMDIHTATNITGRTSSNLPIPVVTSDNKSAIAMAKNDMLHNRSKHIDIKYHFIRDEITKGTISLQWISTHDQVADIFTKTLVPRLFLKFRDLLVKKFQEL